jgi:hypothetical protein
MNVGVGMISIDSEYTSQTTSSTAATQQVHQHHDRKHPSVRERRAGSEGIGGEEREARR